MIVDDVFADDDLICTIFKDFEGDWDALPGCKGPMRVDPTKRLLVSAVCELYPICAGVVYWEVI